MDTEDDGIEEVSAACGLVVEINGLSAGIEVETEVSAGSAGLAIGIKDEVTARSEDRRAAREGVLVGQRSVVGEAHPGKINRGCAIVVKLDQVRRGARVSEGGRVQGENFIQANLGHGRWHVAGVDRPGAGSGD